MRIELWFQGLKDLDYIIQEKTLLEYVFDFEFDSNVTESAWHSIEMFRYSL